jgi:hypothetical protein
MMHDYIRHGTTTLFAALNVLDGSVIGGCMARHRHQEFIRFLNAIEGQVPAGKVVPVILGHYAADKTRTCASGWARHLRWIFHFTPTSGSWLNAVQAFFATLTRRLHTRRLSVVGRPPDAINYYLAEHNRGPEPFVWTANPTASSKNQPRVTNVRVKPLARADGRGPGCRCGSRVGPGALPDALK